MKIRAHRGSIEEAMETCQEIEPTIQAVIDYMQEDVIPLAHALTVGQYEKRSITVSVVDYFDLPDDRIGWQKTFLVLLDGQAYGFTDEKPVPSEYTFEYEP